MEAAALRKWARLPVGQGAAYGLSRSCRAGCNVSGQALECGGDRRGDGRIGSELLRCSRVREQRDGDACMSRESALPW